jgi:hypothetical protein
MGPVDYVEGMMIGLTISAHALKGGWVQVCDETDLLKRFGTRCREHGLPVLQTQVRFS